jgi:lysophospholipase L1-like esterase
MHPSGANCLVRDARLGYALRPECEGTLHGTPLRTTRLGMRGDEVPDADGAVPILALGDSCTFGWRVAEHASYPARLEQVLAERYGPGRYRVLNAGVPGYTSHQGALILDARAPELHPAIVLIAFGFNDNLRERDIETQLAAARAWMPLLRIDDFLLSHSVFYQRVRQALTGSGAENPAAPPRVTPERYGENLKAMIARARAAGAQPVLVNFAFDNRIWEDTEPTRWIGQYIDVFNRVASELDVPALTYRGPRLDEIHPDAEGYQWLVADLLEVMDARKILPPVPAH